MSLFMVIRTLINKSLQSLARHIVPNEARVLLYRIIGFRIGSNTFIGKHVSIDITLPSLVKIGDNVGLAANVTILTHRRDLHDYSKSKGYNDYPFIQQPVVIHDNAQIGCGSIILPGVSIGRATIVAAGSVVTKSAPDNCLIAGNPARVIKEYLDVQS